MIRTKLALALAGALVVGFAGALGASGCSSSSSNGAGADAGFDPSTYEGGIGIGLVNCVPSTCLSNDLCGDAAVNCPSPGLCGGTLLSPVEPISFCTLPCAKNTDCPSGTGCEMKETHGHCLKTCTSNSDCSGGFACALDAGASGSFCWSPFSGADMEGGLPVPEAGQGQPEAGAEAGASEAAAPEGGGGPEAGQDAGSDGSSATDSAGGDAGSDAASE
jgi:hypothetical protein